MFDLSYSLTNSQINIVIYYKYCIILGKYNK